MAITQRSYDEIVELFKAQIQNRFPNADFTEGSFYSVMSGAVALALLELQAYSFERFSKTFFLNASTIGEELELLALDHFGAGARRPEPKRAFGVLDITTQIGQTSTDILVDEGVRFMLGTLEFQSTSEILSVADSPTIIPAVPAVPKSQITFVTGVSSSENDSFIYRVSSGQGTLTPDIPQLEYLALEYLDERIDNENGRVSIILEEGLRLSSFTLRGTTYNVSQSDFRTRGYFFHAGRGSFTDLDERTLYDITLTLTDGTVLGAGVDAIPEQVIPPPPRTFQVAVEALESGTAGNIRSNQMDWTSPLQNVDIVNPLDFVGGNDMFSDDDYKEFITNFVRSLQSGTAQGVEGAALLVGGVSKARLVKKLISVGSLKPDGDLETAPTKFNAVYPKLYVFGEVDTVNAETLRLVGEEVDRHKSAGDFIETIAAEPVSVDLSVTLQFTSTPEALALANNKPLLEEEISKLINNYAISRDFDRSTLQSELQAANVWTGLFTLTVNLPTGDITIEEHQKLVLGTLEVTIT